MGPEFQQNDEIKEIERAERIKKLIEEKSPLVYVSIPSSISPERRSGTQVVTERADGKEVMRVITQILARTTSPSRRSYYDEIRSPSSSIHEILVSEQDRISYYATGGDFFDFSKRGGQELFITFPLAADEKIAQEILADPKMIRKIAEEAVANSEGFSLEDWETGSRLDNTPIRPPYEKWDEEGFQISVLSV